MCWATSVERDVASAYGDGVITVRADGDRIDIPQPVAVVSSAPGYLDNRVYVSFSDH